MTTPDLVGYVYGVRAWPGSTGGRLGGWAPGPNVASCRYGLPHLSPAEGCECGFYAYHESNRFRTNGSYGEVIGLVRGWGTLSVARDGWRAQYAQVVAIAQDSPHADQIAVHYNVPTMPLRHIDEIARSHAVPAALRPGDRCEPPPLLLGVVQDPTRRSRDHAEILWALSCMLLSMGAIAALAFNVAIFPVITAWLLGMIVCGAAWWWNR